MATTKYEWGIEVLKLGAISWLLWIALRDAAFEDTLWSSAVTLLRVGFVVAIYSLSRSLARIHDEAWKNYLLIFYLASTFTLFSWAYYGMHTENADPLFGGGETLVDFVPSKLEKADHALNVFCLLLVPGLYGVYRERKS